MATRDRGDPRSWGLPQELGRLDEGRATPRIRPRKRQRGPHPDLVLEFPDLHRYTGSVDLSYLYLETFPPLKEARKWVGFSGWNEAAQQAFDHYWPPSLDNYVAGLIDAYGSQWAHAFANLARIQQPEFVQHLEELSESGDMALDNMYRGRVDVTVDIALRIGTLRYGMGRYTWPFPMPIECSVCGEPSFYDFVRYWLLRRYGQPGVCALCLATAAAEPLPGAFPMTDCDSASTADQVQAAITVLAQLALHSGVIPPKNFRSVITTVGMEADRRRRVIASLMSLPNASEMQAAIGVGTWLEVLQHADLLTDAWRPSRGTICIAADGHPCRSLGERAVDDWLHLHGIAHDVEPKYPAHAELNPSAGLRADWKVGDTYIEFAGMLEKKSYAEKIAVKVRLASAAGLSLRIVAPEDLYRLDEVLAGLDGPASDDRLRPLG